MKERKKMRKFWRLFICALFFVVFSGDMIMAAAAPNSGNSPRSQTLHPKYKEGELLIKFKKGISDTRIRNFHQRQGSEKIREFKRLRFQHIKIKKGVTVQEALARFRSDPDVEMVGPNYIYEADDIFPSDIGFTELWGLHNTGQTGGTPDADIDGPEAWDITTGDTDTVVAIIDTGIDYNHEDLIGNVWVNPGEIPNNGVDDDGNGYIDDIHGIDAINQDSDPLDDHGHGSHVAGTIGASANNGVGVAGLNWNIQLLGCKILDAGGSGESAAAIECLEYIKDLKDNHNVNVAASNNSYGGLGEDLLFYDAINDQQDILFVAAAGNSNKDTDELPHYPASFDLPNIMAIAATDHDDKKPFFSNYSRRSVHIGAPGVEILSTVLGNSYEFHSGTSMASPHVTGLAALLKSQDQSRNPLDIKNLILAGGDEIPSMDNTTASGRRINAHGSLDCIDRPLLRTVDFPDIPEIGVAATVAALSINCAAPVGPVTLTLSGGELIDLFDDGFAEDNTADDGIYSGTWIPTREVEQLTFTSPELTEIFTVPQFKINTPRFLPFASIEKPYSFTLAATGGLPPYTWSLSAGSLPPGLTLDGFTGEISGAPVLPGDYVFTVQAQESYLTTKTQEFILSVNSLYELWTRTYGSGALDSGYGIAVDSDGNVYVTGTSYTGIGPGNDVVTVKYDTYGNLQWTATFDGGFSDSGVDIILDNSGNLYVTGTSWNTPSSAPDPDYDYLIIKYDASSGTEIWSRGYGDAGSLELAQSIAADPFGNIFVTGTVLPEPYSKDRNILTIKVDAAGNVQPFAVYDSGNTDWAGGVVTDAGGNVIVTGDIYHAMHPSPDISIENFFTVKYDPNGNMLWTRNHGQENIADRSKKMAIDNAGNLYIVGHTYKPFSGNPANNYEIIKLAPDGNQIWSTIYDSGTFDYAFGIAVDARGEVYVTGYSGNGEGYDCITLVLDSEGNITDMVGYSSTGGAAGRDIVVGDDRSIYVLGNTDEDFFTIKYVDHLSITTLELANGQAGIPYNQYVYAAKGLPPYSWSLFSGDLPDGLSLDSWTGQLSGTPPALGTFDFTLQVTDSNLATAVHPYTVTIYDPLAPFALTTSSLPAGPYGAFYSQSLSATGGLPPYTWTLTAGDLPEGLKLNSLTGEISGVPMATDNYSFIIEVADSAGNFASKSLEIQIHPNWDLVVNLSIGISGEGLVTSNPAGIDCPGDCTEPYPAGTQVTLTATPAPGSSFERWNWGSCDNEECDVIMSGDIDITATFWLSPPAADFSGYPLTGTAPLIVSFTDLSANSPTNWLWDFGDLQTCTDQHPFHVYETPGTYSISLTATNTVGLDTVTKTDYITVAPCPYLPVRIGGAYHSTLQAAYEAASDGEVIESQALSFTEDLLFNRNIAITLAGGSNCEYTDSVANTAINGLVIRGGKVIVENIAIRSN